jgi:hypothetical protein
MADVAADLKSWSTTAASNSPSGSTAVGTGLDDNLRELQKVVRQDLASKGADIVAASTTDVGAVAGWMHDITGTTTITSLGTVSAGITKILKFEGVLTLTHNATSLILPGGANITTANGDIGIFISEGSGNWRCVNYTKIGTAPAAISAAQTFLGSDVNLNNTASYFDVVNTGSIGASGQTWLIKANACVTDTTSGQVLVRIWDGSTVYVETNITIGAANHLETCYVEAVVTLSAATTFYLSCKDSSNTSGVAKTTAGAGTANKATWITAMRLT